MSEENELLKKRFIELAMKADRGAYYTFTDFLGLPEQTAFSEIGSRIRGIKYSLFGGAPGCERIMVRFGDPDEIGYDQPFPIVCILAEPVSQKFADKLTHRDFLGALMNLGIERSTLGDIVIRDNVGYIFASSDIAPYVISELTRIRNTDVRLSITEEIPTDTLFKTEERRVQISSERLDALLARVLCLSREDSQKLFARGLVYINGVLCQSVSRAPKEGDKISVRGFGKMIYRGFDSLTKKGKLNAVVEVYV